MALSVAGFKKLSAGEKAKYLKKYPNSMHGKKATKSVKPATKSKYIRVDDSSLHLSSTKLKQLEAKEDTLRDKIERLKFRTVLGPLVKTGTGNAPKQRRKTLEKIPPTPASRLKIKALKASLAELRIKISKERSSLIAKRKLANAKSKVKARPRVLSRSKPHSGGTKRR